MSSLRNSTILDDTLLAGGSSAIPNRSSQNEPTKRSIFTCYLSLTRYQEATLTRLAFAAVCFGAALGINVFTNAIASRRYPKIPALPDVLFETVPHLVEFFDTPDIVLYVIIGATLLFVLWEDRRWIITKRTFFIWALCLYLRCICVPLTNLPDASQRCETLQQKSMKLLRGSCGDLIFSGHTVAFILMALTMTQYARSVALKILVWLVVAFGIASIIATHRHYSVDVVLAVIITTLVYEVVTLRMSTHSKTQQNAFFRWFTKDERLFSKKRATLDMAHIV